ncbi:MULTISPECIES: IS1595 family transposase [Acidobacteriaceae]|uniref:IS1595 family transposase n=1 Tax=Acidobacteriaceae TaxID=204434 RepID=UPI00131CD871|nr:MULTISPECIES: IS1595 family transposase [Acidobacteriaceae]MDW5266474.1 IS1595 family transposase [Edaphobacter sp.]
METPKTLLEAINFFSVYENCRQFMIAIRWADGVVRCPYCDATKLTYLEKARVYRCYGDHAKQKFSLKVGTIFEDSAIGLEKWLPAAWLLSNCKNGISSYELARALGVTQKSAWHMLHRLREAMTDETGKIGGNGTPVECDETFIVPKTQKMHKAKRIQYHATGGSKAVVLGMLERGGRVKAAVIPARHKMHMNPVMTANVEAGANIMTDEFATYGVLDTPYNREVITHAMEYVNGHIHTQGIENFWALLKRGLRGTYVSVEPFHLDAYVKEQVFRYNNRKDADDFTRFATCMMGIQGKRLTYQALTQRPSVV